MAGMSGRDRTDHPPHGWAARFPLVPLALFFLAGTFAGDAGGGARIPSLACLGLAILRPTPLAFAGGGFAAGVLVSSLPRAPVREPAVSALEGSWLGRVESVDRGLFGEEQAIV